MSKELTYAGIWHYYNKVHEFPTFAAELSAYQLAEVRKHGNSIVDHAWEIARELLDGNPDYPYPPEYIGGRKMEYWVLKNATCQDAVQVINTIDKLINPEPKQEETLAQKTAKEKLKASQIALIHVYDGPQITRDNGGEIAAKHGYTAKTSGEALYQEYTTYTSHANRTGNPGTKIRLQNKIKLLESILEHLTDEAEQRASDELRILETILKNEYL